MEDTIPKAEKSLIVEAKEDLIQRAKEDLVLRAEEEFKNKIELFPRFLVLNEDIEVRDFIEQLCALFVLNEFKKREERFLLKNWGRIRSIIYNGKPFHIHSVYPQKKPIIGDLSMRLKELKIYKIADKKTIYDYLTGETIVQISLEKDDVEFLKHIKENSLATYADWGREFGITRQSARSRFERLGEQLYPVIAAWLNYKKIKLKFLLGYVDVGKRLFLLNNLSKGILNSVFGRSVGKFRSSLSEIYFTFQVPEDHRCQAFLEKSFKKMADEGLIKSHKLVEVVAVSGDIDFTLYNAEKNSWIFSPEFWLNYLKYYLVECEEFEEPPKTFDFEPYSSKIDRLDLKILDALQVDGRISSNFLAKQFKYSPVKVNKKRKRLIEENFVDFYFAVRNMGSVGFFTILMEGDKLARIRFKKACLKFPQWYFYDYIGKESVEGSVFAFEVPTAQIWKLYCYLDDLTPDFGIKKIWYDFFPFGSLPLSNLIERWDERRQRWRWNQSDFDLIALSKIERYLKK